MKTQFNQRLYRGLATLLFFLSANQVFAQEQAEQDLVRHACLNYIDGFYQGDTSKVKMSTRMTLYKNGYWKSQKTGQYDLHSMTYERAIIYANDLLEKKTFPTNDAPKKVEIFDIQEHIASAKITAWWGVDYLLLSKEEGVWKIEQVLWQGPLQ